jgi:predicted phosphodiesterase
MTVAAANAAKDLHQGFTEAEVLHLGPEDRVLIISDFHMGNGGRSDDLIKNQELIQDLLEKYYLPQNWYVVLNGDIEELQRYSYTKIRSYWKKLYEIFDAFYQKGRLYKILGNHDDDLILEKHYPFPLLGSLRIETPVIPVYVFHGHQSSKIYTNYNNLVRASLRYFFKPLGIRNISSGRSPRHRFAVEKKAYDYARTNGIISIIGHTHRPLFESLGRFDYIKFEIERLCREYPLATGEDRKRIADEVLFLRIELAKLKRSERRNSIKESLYGDELPVPCLFNSGCAIGKKGINAIELDSSTISLVYWFTEGMGKKFVHRGSYTIDVLEGTEQRRSVLNTNRLDYIKAKIELLG